MAGGKQKNRLVLSVAAALFLGIVVMETFIPANVVGAYGFVLPILLVATVRNRKLMYLTLALCIIATYIGLLRPTKPGRFVSAVINRTVVACVLGIVAYVSMTGEERKAREEAARAALALQTENLLRANAQLVEIKDKLNRSERLAALGQLVASVAHEVGTPLHSIAWHVQALAEEPGVTPGMKKRIEIIDEQINRVVQIIQDLLSSTRQRKPEPTWLPVECLVRPVAALMEPAFHAKGVALRVELGPDPPQVWADADKLQQVLVNLLTNALTATPSGGEVHVSVGIRPASTDEADAGLRASRPLVEKMVTVTVSDTGCGMPKEHLQRAFEPFFTTKALGRGTGLGLFLSRETVTAHGGCLTIDSEEGKGTTVVIALPGLGKRPVEALS
ncbi:MAG TPA: ATP-binding protein [Nitrospiraceae bacterium]|nr:ATP-binding protein [Nitrospiraceae bacterium]